MPAIHTAENALQKQIRHAHVSQRVHKSRMTQEIMVYFARSSIPTSDIAKASAVAASGDSSRAGAFFSRLSVTLSFITTNR